MLGVGPLGKFMAYAPVDPSVWRLLATHGPAGGPGQGCLLPVWVEP